MKNFYLIIATLISGMYSAQESIQTDRPDQTESTSITPKNFLQLEGGILYEKLTAGNETWSHPTVLWKYGVTENWELRVITEFNSEKKEENTANGLAPVTLGFKAKLSDEKKILPKISFIGHLTLNRLASEGFKTPQPAPSFRFLFQHTLSDKINIGYNLGAEWNGETADPTGIYTFSTAYSITGRIGFFAEIYGFFNAQQAADHRFDAGFTYLLTDHVQVDASAGIGISEISPKYFVSGGISYRFRTF